MQAKDEPLSGPAFPKTGFSRLCSGHDRAVPFSNNSE